MQLEQINKQLYRSRLNKIIIAFILSFGVLAVIFGQILIMLLSAPEADNFWLNLSGVILALISVFSIINHFKQHPVMHEAWYVWRLKQQINFIFRKLKKVKSAAYEHSNIDALIILAFYYKACNQLYLLDDNTITLSSLHSEQAILDAFIEQHNLQISVEDYEQQLINSI